MNIFLRKTVLASVVAVAMLAPGLALASSCGDEIARLQKQVDASRARGGGVADLPESSFATMHRQPTRDSVAAAKAASEDKASSILEEARKLDAEGKQAECVKTLSTIILPK